MLPLTSEGYLFAGASGSGRCFSHTVYGPSSGEVGSCFGHYRLQDPKNPSNSNVDAEPHSDLVIIKKILAQQVVSVLRTKLL